MNETIPGKVCIFASGSGTNLQSLIESSREESCPFKVSLVISDRRNSYALVRAREAQVPGYYIRYKKHDAHLFKTNALELLKQYCIDIIVLAGFLKFIPGDILSAYQNRILNIHPALLPSFGGTGMYGINVHKSVLDSGVKVTGVTVHLVNEAYDAGPIIAQVPVLTRWDDTPETLSKRVLEQEHIILPQAVKAIALDLLDIKGRKVYLKKPANGIDPRYFGMA